LPVPTKIVLPTATAEPVQEIVAFFTHVGVNQIKFDAENSYLLYKDGSQLACYLTACEYKWDFAGNITDFPAPSQVIIGLSVKAYSVTLTVCWHGLCDSFTETIQKYNK
jgi:hypothetical protein